jgi:hypothetical protein
MYNSTCFGRPHAHHQELNYSSSLWFYRWRVVVAMLLVVVGPIGPTTTNGTATTTLQRVKPEATTAVVVAPDDGREDARNMLSCT